MYNRNDSTPFSVQLIAYYNKPAGDGKEIAI